MSEFISSRCIFRSPEHKLLSKSGGRLEWLLDLRIALLDPGTLDDITTLFWTRAATLLPFQICGVETAANHLVSGIQIKGVALGYNINAFVVRKQRKLHGRAQLIEGTIGSEPIVLIDDLLNSGSSLGKALRLLQGGGHKITHCIVVIDFKSDRGLAWRKENDLPVSSLFDLSQFGLKTTSRSAPPQRHGFMPVWQHSGEAPLRVDRVPKSVPVCSGDDVIFCDASSLSCLSIYDGRIKWKFAVDGAGGKGIWSTPLIHHGRVVFGAYNGSLYCLNQLDGKSMWKRRACDWIGSSPVVIPDHNFTALGLEFARTGEAGAIAAFSIESGHQIWYHTLKNLQHGSGVHFPENDSVVFGTSDNTIVALSSSDGVPLWSHPSGSPVKQRLALDLERRVVAASTLDGQIHILDAMEGRCIAVFELGGSCRGSPLIAGGRLFGGSTNGIFLVVDLNTGKKELILNLGAAIIAAPTATDDYVFVATIDGRVHVLELENLAQKGNVVVPGHITTSVTPSMDGNCIVVPTAENELFCFRRRSFNG